MRPGELTVAIEVTAVNTCQPGWLQEGVCERRQGGGGRCAAAAADRLIDGNPHSSDARHCLDGSAYQA